MKHVLMLITTLLLSLTVFSKSDTDTLKLSHQVGKHIAIDLVSCDSTKLVLQTTTKVLEMTEDKSRMKDTVINSFEVKTDLYKQQISLYEAKEESYKTMITSFQKDLMKQKIKTKFTTFTGIFIGLVSTFVIIGQSR